MLERDLAVLSSLKVGDLAGALCHGEEIRAKFTEALASLLNEA
jgi:hypothetical protein